jgi:hypothetical protein
LIAPAAHILHITIYCGTHSDKTVLKFAQSLQNDFSSWRRQLLFSLDPANFESLHEGVGYILMQEFDSSHTAESLAANVDIASLRWLLGDITAEATVRILSLDGSATHHNMTPNGLADLKIDNRTYAETVSDGTQRETYFGLRPEPYVH